MPSATFQIARGGPRSYGRGFVRWIAGRVYTTTDPKMIAWLLESPIFDVKVAPLPKPSKSAADEAPEEVVEASAVVKPAYAAPAPTPPTKARRGYTRRKKAK